ncbi:MAG TPA: PIN domain-containing protein [Candidatus Hydrogenedentes bacterium]|nr:PIN domain-containing protein [Candidatus Hydrogenedentota bacterium]HNT89717.1 PIN domain-containing protein [Candidatus Hydrogenedentota bacterium]
MTRAFADTAFYIASANSDDALHETALEASDACDGGFLTTEYVLLELGNYFCAGNRSLFLKLLQIIEVDPDTDVVPASSNLHKEGIRLYASRPDKSWSLTDCISFVVMRQYGLTNVLTSDRHFEQAGFRVLLYR